MAVVIRNIQRGVKIDISRFRKNVNILVSCSDYKGYDMGILLVSNSDIQELNHQYRGINEATDVLAFPYHEIPPENAGKLPDIDPEECMLGDIVLGVPYIHSECMRKREDFHGILVSMVTHGICHLVGFDHETEQQWQQMKKQELHILQKFNKLTGHHCVPLLGLGHYY